MFIGRTHGCTPAFIQVQRQDGLVQLHPGAIPQCAQQLAIGLQQGRQQLQPVEGFALGLAEVQEGQRTDQHRLGLHTGLAGLFHLGEQVIRFDTETLPRRQLRHQIVIVGVEPFGHFQGVNILATPGHAEIALEPWGRPEALRNSAQAHHHVQHGIIEREIPHRDPVEPGTALRLPASLAHGLGHLQQGGLIRRAAPEVFQGKLEFPLAPHARETDDVGLDGMCLGVFLVHRLVLRGS